MFCNARLPFHRTVYPELLFASLLLLAPLLLLVPLLLFVHFVLY